MKLTLDHTQRLNLHALLGAQRADVGSIRAIWRIQDKIMLGDEEQKAIDLKRKFVGGQERVMWDPSRCVALQHYEFADAEICRIKIAIESCESFAASLDRRWLEPLIAQLFLSEPKE